jgi:hypothetical protein
MQVGYAVRDITPSPGLTLSGFAARCDYPSEGVDDPIEAHALAIKGNSGLTLSIVFDLLGLGPELTVRLRTAIERALDASGHGRVRVILCCTHTHSAPSTVKLLGCGIPDAPFWDRLENAAVQAATEAVGNLRPAVASYATPAVAGISYNRRKVLAGGRVVMTPDPDEPVVKSGPTWERALLVRFEGPGGDPIAGIVSWAAHPCVVCSLNVSADYPGELRRSLAKNFGFPFLFLQGPCANLNLPFSKMSRAEMLENARKITASLVNAAWVAPADGWPVERAVDEVSLDYAPPAETGELEAIRAGMTRISETGRGPDSTMLLLANILNVEPGAEAEPALVRHTAAALAQWSCETLKCRSDNRPARLAVDVLRLGPLWFAFVAAELFAETGLALQARFPESIIVPVGYASPLLGYLPTDDALDEGGYEVGFAYRFYGHPAPFARGSEAKVRARIEEMVLSMQGGST